ncbi:MFS general substrate transporter [Exidia glandulosa HHB12029]|uniref:MFS general substrate transporter n=1 Tax=Exidia glandulosa HHB12029 TaxID=1314781 RepID=A0A165LID4_EXIGL|nr:MFS general substrate transporter [Exidia glandulosa HHB12029]
MPETTKSTLAGGPDKAEVTVDVVEAQRPLRNLRSLRAPNLGRLEVSPGHALDASDDADDFKLPNRTYLAVILVCNLLLQISFFIVVSSSNEYAHALGGDSTFSGIVIGIPAVFSIIAILPLMRYDHGTYKLPLHVCCSAQILGHLLYALAYRAQFLYLILIGRMVQGVGFTMLMYCKRYCSDPRFVGIRRRTTLAGAIVITQGLGMTLGPLFGGLLFKIGFPNQVFNGLSSPGWIMAVVWLAFWGVANAVYHDPPAAPPLQPPAPVEEFELAPIPTQSFTNETGLHHRSREHPAPTVTASARADVAHITRANWMVAVLMCWCALAAFFVLGAWESNIPVFTSSDLSSTSLHFSPTGAGNFIALGGLIAAPLLLLNALFARRLQDRHILVFGCGVGTAGIVVFMSLIGSGVRVGYGPLLICWAAVALGFNVATTVTLSLMSKVLPPAWNGRSSLAVQYSINCGRVAGAIWGGSGVAVGMLHYLALEVGMVGIVAAMTVVLWRDMKAKTG